MKIKFYDLSGIYNIPIKRFEPKSDVIGFIVAVHGFGGDKESSAIAALAERMTGQGYAVIAFDLPGHGGSRADEFFCAANCRLDLENVYKHACDLYPEAEKKAQRSISKPLSSIFPDYAYTLIHSLKVNDPRIIKRGRFDREITFISHLINKPEKTFKVDLPVTDM